MSVKSWYRVRDESHLMTPALLVYPNRVKKNIESMIEISGDVNRLIPHVKTYKMSAIVNLQMGYGIKEFKCATLGELKMLISCKVNHILLAIQPTREKMIRFLDAQKQNPDITFSTLFDNNESLKLFLDLAESQNQKINLWLDINNGMNRTGIKPEIALELYVKAFKSDKINVLGVHVYDGHTRIHDLEKRIDKCNKDFEAVKILIDQIRNKGGEVPDQIRGGSPSFYPHSLSKSCRLSPGTTLLWDLGYKKIWNESPFIHAAILALRLISKPSSNILCFDLGHKAVASEMPLPRIEIIGLEGALQKGQSEEHLIVEHKDADNYNIGDLFYAIPYHICPTVAKYSKAYTVTEGDLGPFWEIEARDYQQVE
jgi:D-serine deaminase-like pyridoxal phosphate-dependent protein